VEAGHFGKTNIGISILTKQEFTNSFADMKSTLVFRSQVVALPANYSARKYEQTIF